MSIFKTINIISVSLVFSFYLAGCAATPSPSIPAGPSEPAAETLAAISETAPQAPAAVEPVKETEEPVQDPSGNSILEYWQSPDSGRIQYDFAEIEFVQHRVIIYENKFEKWLEISETALEAERGAEIASLEMECTQKLESILRGYTSLMEKMQQGKGVSPDPTVSVTPQKIQQLDIAFLESRCNQLLAKDIADLYEPLPAMTEPKPTFAAVQEIIASQFNQGNYQEVLFAYGNLSRDYPDLKPSLATRLFYGRALQYTGQIEAAARHLTGMLDSGDLSVEPLSIQREIADLLLAANDPAAAEFYYDSTILAHQSLDAEKNWAREQLTFLQSVDTASEDMIAYTKLLREFQTYDYRMHAPRLNEQINVFATEHAGSPLAVSALRLRTFAQDRLKSWFGRQLLRIDGLVAEKKFSQAIEILKTLSLYHLPAELQAVLQKTFYDVAQAEIQEMETQRMIKEMELTDQWNSAVSLLESEQYELAITAFEALFGTEYEEKAKMKITEAANQAAGQMRKEAASLFIRAGKTPDLEQKKNLLLESHRLLTGILTRYPQTDLADKIQQNISILEEQIERFDPSLLEELRLEDSAEFTTDPYGTRARQFQ